MTTVHDHGAAGVLPQFARAGWFLESLAAQDIAQLGGTLAPDARLRALLPLGLREWTGAEVTATGLKATMPDTLATSSASWLPPATTRSPPRSCERTCSSSSWSALLQGHRDADSFAAGA
jgi:hypothetical protein